MPQRILLVDDDLATTRSLKQFLTAHRYEVLEENDSRKALEAAKSFQPDVVVLDFQMPEAHGGDVAWQLASEPGLRKTLRIILCSGLPNKEFALKLPPIKIHILEKPVLTEKLLQMLRETENGTTSSP